MDTEGLREYMSKFGDLEDCIVMKVSSSFDFYSHYLIYMIFSLIKLGLDFFCFLNEKCY